MKGQSGLRQKLMLSFEREVDGSDDAADSEYAFVSLNTIGLRAPGVDPVYAFNSLVAEVEVGCEETCFGLLWGKAHMFPNLHVPARYLS
jgi:hypothetical protein